MEASKNFIINKLLFSFSLTLQPIKSQQCISEAELISEKWFYLLRVGLHLLGPVGASKHNYMRYE